MRIRGLSVAVATGLVLLSSAAVAGPFTSGNVVVYRVGDGVATLGTASATVSLVEFAPTGGTAVQTISMPIIANGLNRPLTAAGSATSEGFMTLSAQGQHLVVTGYDAIPGTAAIAATASAATNRVVGRIDANGNIDTSTRLTAAFSGSNIRSVASDDGTRFWASGTASPASAGGMWFTTLGAIGGEVQVAAAPSNSRVSGIFGGQLYLDSGSTGVMMNSVGTGLPTTAGQTSTILPGFPVAAGPSPYGFVALDRDPGVAGIDTIYFADDRSVASGGGVQKYSFDGVTWTARGVSNAFNARGLAGAVNGANAVLFATGTAGSANTLMTLTDTAVFNANISGALTVIATAPALTAFRGVAFVPQAAGVPVLSISAAPTIAEGNPGCVAGTNKLIFPVTASPAPGAELAFTATITGGSATAPTDIGTLAIVNVNAGGSGSVEVPVNCDLKIEGNETVEVTLQDGAAYDLNAGSTVATSTINNDDLGEIFITSVAQAEGTGANSTFAFNVNLGGGVLAGAGGVSVNYDVVAAGATPATITTDFTGASATLTILEDANSGVINVTVIADSDDELDETFAVNLSSPVNATIGDNQALGTIQNDDSVIPQISINDVGVTEGNSGITNAVFTVTINPAPVGTVTVDYATADGITNPANVGVDFTNTTGNLSFDALNTSRQISVPVVGETSVELDETYFVNLSNIIGSAAFAGGDAQGLGTITNDDFNVVLSIPTTLSIAEGNSGTTNAAIVVSSDRVPNGTITFTTTTFNGTATDGSDYNGALTSGIAFDSTNCAVGPALPCSRTVNVPIRGDLINESDETFVLQLSAVNGTNASAGNASITVTITNDDTAPLTIEQIQGTGHASPSAGQTVTTLGNIVTAVLPAPNGGFMMQMKDADASGDTASSNGIFVFTGGTPSIQVGDEVDVRGGIIEFSTSGTATAPQRVTEFTNTGLVFTITSSGNPLPAPIILDATVPSPNPATPSCGAVLGNFECFESMRVTTATGMINLGNQTFGTDPVAEMWITTTGVRAFRDGGLLPNKVGEVVPVLVPPAPPLPTTYVYDQNPEVFEIDMDRAGLPNTVLVPGSTFSATGVLTQEFGTFELFPTEFTATSLAPALPTPVPEAGGTQLTVASQNLHLLFDDVNDAWNAADCTAADVDFCPDTARWNAKLNLLSRQIRENLRSPMVIGVQEIEKLGALQALANKINLDLAGAFTYSAHVGAIDNLDGGHQNVGFLIRNDVSVQSLTQLNTTQTWVFNTEAQGEVMDRPPYLLRASVTRAGAPFDFAVMVAHQRSLSGIDVLTPAASLIDAHRVRQKRLYQAALTAQAIQQFRTDNPTVPFYVIGDLNAFPESDGYTDVAGIIRGNTDPALSEYDLSYFGLEGAGVNGNIVDPPLTAASELVPFGERYSYQFQSRPQQIDHAFMTSAGLDRFEDIVFARGNVDQQAQYMISFSNSLGTETPLVSSDHDGFVLFIDAATELMFADGFE